YRAMLSAEQHLRMNEASSVMEDASPSVIRPPILLAASISDQIGSLALGLYQCQAISHRLKSSVSAAPTYRACCTISLRRLGFRSKLWLRRRRRAGTRSNVFVL